MLNKKKLLSSLISKYQEIYHNTDVRFTNSVIDQLINEIKGGHYDE